MDTKFKIALFLLLFPILTNCGEDNTVNPETINIEEKEEDNNDNSTNILPLNIVEDETLSFSPTDFSNTDLSEKNKTIIEGYNTLSFDLFKLIAQDDISQNKNTFVSPFSVVQVLSLLSNGAADKGLMELQKALNYSDSIKDVNLTNVTLNNILAHASENSSFETFNSIWINEGLYVNRSFLDTSKFFYNAEVFGLKFYANDAGKAINSWCADKTHDLISQVVDEGPLDGVLSLANAVYFKNQWLYPFDENKTSQELFTNYDQSQTYVSTMQIVKNTDSLTYVSMNDCDILNIPFHNNFNMVVLMPERNVNVKDFMNSLSLTNWKDIINSLAPKNLRIFLPKFKLESDISLKTYLNKLGINEIFSNSGALSKMSPSGLFVNKVKQSSIINIDEYGAEAAAVTVMQADGSSGGHSTPPADIRIDHPFVFIIYEQNSNVILFTGCVNHL